MDPVTSVKTCFKKYVDFSGRAPRPEYWWFALFEFVCLVVASAVSMKVGYWLYGLAVLAFILPSLAVGVRRLHDIGKSGWFILIGLIPIIGGIILIVFYCLPTQEHNNEWGSPPALTPKV